MITVCDYIAAELQRRGITHVFELSGGMITFLLDSISRLPAIQLVSMHHEQGAGFAAEGYARIKQVPGVALATSGPGATNLLTAIGSCYFDSTPTVFITGQVNRAEQKGDRAVRQLGFQETDIVAMARPITKAAWLVKDPAEVPRLLDAAFALAMSGRPGPVLLDIPMDVQRTKIEPASDQTEAAGRPVVSELPAFVDRLAAGLASARQPLLLLGGGLRSAGCVSQFRAMVDRLGIPAVHSLMGVDVLPGAHPLRIGMIGTYGNRWANMALDESDLLLVLGSRLDVRQTGANVSSFKGTRSIFHVDCESGEMNNRVTGCDSLVCELGEALTALAKLTLPPSAARVSWSFRLAELAAASPDTEELAGLAGINPNRLMRALATVSARAGVYVIDVGQHQMWAAQSLQLTAPQRFLTSGGMGAMGFALPAAVGACLAGGNAPVVVVAGDGGFQVNIQELQTVVRNQLPLKILVINNRCHGMVRQFQESYFAGRYQSTLVGYSAPDFVALAQAYGLPAMRITDAGKTNEALEWLWRDANAPALLEVMIDPGANAYPKMAFGRAFSEMEPKAKPVPMSAT